MADAATVRASGTVRSVNLEGGCWRFEAQDGRHFEIEKGSAPDRLLVDGKQATLTLAAPSGYGEHLYDRAHCRVVKVEP